MDQHSSEIIELGKASIALNVANRVAAQNWISMVLAHTTLDGHRLAYLHFDLTIISRSKLKGILRCLLGRSRCRLHSFLTTRSILRVISKPVKDITGLKSQLTVIGWDRSIIAANSLDRWHHNTTGSGRNTVDLGHNIAA